MNRTSNCLSSWPLLLLAASTLTCGGATDSQKDTKPPFTVAKCTHAVGLCNLPLFVAREDNIIADLAVEIQLINIPNWGDHPAALQSGRVDFSVTPFTNVMTAFANGAPVRVVAGSGINGLYIMGAKDIKSAEGLRGRSIGTFQADTLEMLLFSYLEKNGLTYKDVKIVYFTDAFELVNAMAAGRVDAMTHVEPYATRAETEFGSVRLASGQEIWGGDHPDCVLTASRRIIAEDPDLVKKMILGMLRAQSSIEQDREGAVKKAVGKYYKAELSDILRAAEAQPPGVDIRNKRSFMEARFRDLQRLGYAKATQTSEGLLDFSYLEAVIRENPSLYEQLGFRSEGPERATQPAPQ